ncbi:MAG: TetR/AcrR family transcriptional regulator [Desulfovibrionaceae bacterium]
MTREYVDGAKRRDQIARAALSVLTRDGGAGLTIRRVAAKLGVAPSAIYRHFPDKGAIVDAVLTLVGEMIQDNVDRALEEEDHPLDALGLLLMRHTHFLVSDLGAGHIFLTTEILAHYPDKNQRIATNVEQLAERVSGILLRAAKQGIVRSDIPAHVLARMYVGLFQPPVLHYQLLGGLTHLVGVVEENWSAFRTMVQPQIK